MIDEIMLETEEKMQRAVNGLHNAFGTVRTGRANAMVLDRIKVDYYGVPTPINQMAGVKTPDAHMLVIEPWDKGVLGAIEHAIMESDLGVTPNNDGSASGSSGNHQSCCTLMTRGSTVVVVRARCLMRPLCVSIQHQSPGAMSSEMAVSGWISKIGSGCRSRYAPGWRCSVW